MKNPEFNLDVLGERSRRIVEMQLKEIRKGAPWESPELEPGRKSVIWTCGPVVAFGVVGAFVAVGAGVPAVSIFFMVAAVAGVVVGCVVNFRAYFQFDRQWRAAKLAEIAEQVRTAEALRSGSSNFEPSPNPGWQPWHVEGYDPDRHRGRFTAMDRANMNNWGMTADEYLSNVLDD